MSTETKQPEPPINPIVPLVKKWLTRFETCVRQKLFEQAKLMCHEQVVWMGTESNIAFGWREVELKEWSETWKGQLAFSFDIARASIMPSPDSSQVVVCLPWLARGLIHKSEPKTGRATIVLGVFDEDHKILCIHAHFSKNPVTRLG